jgi:hypothetical protein
MLAEEDFCALACLNPLLPASPEKLRDGLKY